MLNQVTTIRMPDGQEAAFADWQDMPLWSTIDFLSNFTDLELSCFTYTVGDRVPVTANAVANRTATLYDTNVDSPGSMSSTEEMLVYSIRVEYLQLRTLSPNNDPNTGVASSFPDPCPLLVNIFSMQAELMLSLFVSQKIMHEAMLGYYNTGFGPYSPFGHWASGGTGTQSVANGGAPGADAVRALVVPVHIGSQEKFRVAIRNPSGATVPMFNIEADNQSNDIEMMLQLRIYLDGLRKRPVA